MEIKDWMLDIIKFIQQINCEKSKSVDFMAFLNSISPFI